MQIADKRFKEDKNQISPKDNESNDAPCLPESGDDSGSGEARNKISLKRTSSFEKIASLLGMENCGSDRVAKTSKRVKKQRNADEGWSSCLVCQV